MRNALFWVITQRIVVISYGHFESWTLKMGPIGCPETSVRYYHCWWHNSPEERSSQGLDCPLIYKYSSNRQLPYWCRAHLASYPVCSGTSSVARGYRKAKLTRRCRLSWVFRVRSPLPSLRPSVFGSASWTVWWRNLILANYSTRLPIPVATRSKAWVCRHLSDGIVGSRPVERTDVSVVCLSCGGTCVGLITRPEESYWMWCVWLWWRSLNKEDALAH